MLLETYLAKTPASLDELRRRVSNALQRHPLCRDIRFDVVGTPRSRKANWTINLHAVSSDALFEAHEIVADIQEAYELARLA